MALTLVTAPDGFQPVGAGDLFYEFTEASLSGKSNYRVEIELNGLSSVPVFEFRPDASLAIQANIAPMLRAALLMSFTVGERFINTYVKYQAVWDGGSDAQVPLSSNVIYAYTGVNSYLNDRSRFEITTADVGLLTGPLLILPNKGSYPELNVWPGRTAYIEFLHAAITGHTSVNGQILFRGKKYSDYEFASLREDSYDWDATLVEMYSKTFVNKGYGSGTIIVDGTHTAINESDYANNKNITGTSTKFAQMFRYSSADSGIYFRILKVGSPTVRLRIKFLTTSGGAHTPTTTSVFEKSIDLTYLSSVTPDWLYIDLTEAPLSALSYYAISFEIDTLDTEGTYDASNYYRLYKSTGSTHSPEAAFYWNGTVWTDDSGDLGSYYVTPTTLSFFTILENEECDNPIYLKWLNDLGSISVWLFDVDQGFENEPQQFGRFINKTVFAINVSFEQWKMLQELNKTGVEYGDNLKSGALVQDFTDESNPISVYVIPGNKSTQTRLIGNKMDLVLRYPLIRNIGI